MCDLESQLVQAPTTMAPVLPPLVTPGGKPLDVRSLTNYPTLLNIQFDIATAALRADITRVVTVQLSTAWGDSHTFPWLAGANTRPWHRIGHEEENNGRNEQRVLVKWLMTQFAALLDRLAAVPEVGPSSKTLLDNTIVVWASTMLNGNHAAKLPWILAGKGGGTLRTGSYLRSAGDTPVNRVMIDLCKAMEVPVTYVGSPALTGSVPGLLV